MEIERRRTPRFAFDTTAEIVVVGKLGAGIAARVSDLSLGGCLLVGKHRLAVGTSVLVKIRTQTDYFQSLATVVHSSPERGTGVMFDSVSPRFLSVLQKWLLAAMRDHQPVGAQDQCRSSH